MVTDDNVYDLAVCQNLRHASGPMRAAALVAGIRRRLAQPDPQTLTLKGTPLMTEPRRRGPLAAAMKSSALFKDYLASLDNEEEIEAAFVELEKRAMARPKPPTPKPGGVRGMSRCRRRVCVARD